MLYYAPRQNAKERIETETKTLNSDPIEPKIKWHLKNNNNTFEWISSVRNVHQSTVMYLASSGIPSCTR